MDGTSQVRGFLVVLAGYIASAAWYWLNLGVPRTTGSEELTGGVLIAFVLPTTAAVLLWLFHAIEARRPVCVREPDDCAATERILFRILVFIAALHGLVLLLLTEAPWVRSWGLQLTFVLVGALLVSVGNLLPQTRPNVLVGIRTPRSLRSRQFWMEINRVGGYVAVALGLVVIVAAVVLGSPLVGQVILAAVLAAVAILVERYLTLVRASEQV
jgi:SdpI/YfhL protein family